MDALGALLNGLAFAPYRHHDVASFEPMTFLENLEVQPDGTLLVTSQLDGRIWQVAEGRVPRVLAQVDGRVASIASRPDGGWLAFGTLVGGASCVFAIEQDGSTSHWLALPDCVFPNGVQRLANGRYLLADSMTGTVWCIDWPACTARVWLRDALLGTVPHVPYPGINGIKLFEGRVYMSNSAQASIVSVSLVDGAAGDDLQVVAKGVPVDDFAFDVDGAMYLTTHPFNTLIRRDPDGTMTRIATADQGVNGCTACRFGTAPGGESDLYVIGDGGLYNPSPLGIQPARIVRLNASRPGAPVDQPEA